MVKEIIPDLSRLPQQKGSKMQHLAENASAQHGDLNIPGYMDTFMNSRLYDLDTWIAISRLCSIQKAPMHEMCKPIVFFEAMEAFGFTVISKEAPWDEKIATLSPFAKGDMISIGDEWGERALVARALFKCLRKLDNGAFMFDSNPKVDKFYGLPSEQVNTYF